MKKIIQKIFMVMFALFLFWGSTISADAMSNEEKELLDMLGVEYKVDENGDFKEFVVSETTPRITGEDLVRFAKAYEPKDKVGKYWLYYRFSEDGTKAEFQITDSETRQSVFCGWPDTIAFTDADNDYHSFVYENDTEQEPLTFCVGNSTLNEAGYHPYEEYSKNEQGEYVIKSKIEGDIFSSFDKNGQLRFTEDLTTDIRYDTEGNAVSQTIFPPEHYENQPGAGLAIVVPIEVADEVKAVLEQKGGKYMIEVPGEEDTYEFDPEVMEIIDDANTAKSLGLDLEDFRERKKTYKDLVKAKGCGLSAAVKAEIFGVDANKIPWTATYVGEDELPDTLSKEKIADNLFILINEYRTENGLQPLDNSDALLQQVADIRAEESSFLMDSTHSRPLVGNSDSFGVGENQAAVDFNFNMTSEEIAQKIFDAWKASDSNNQNMLSEEYTQGNLGVQFVLASCGFTVYVTSDFYYEDYQENADDTLLRMIEVGAQVPGKIDSTREYYEKFLKDTLPTESTHEQSNKDNSSSEQKNEHMGKGNLQIYDEYGNRFKLPNGKEWVSAWTDFKTGTLYDKNGNEVQKKFGRINFVCENGEIYFLYVAAGPVPRSQYSVEETYYLNTNYPEDQIVLGVFPEYYNLEWAVGQYTESEWASTACYYIINGDVKE